MTNTKIFKIIKNFDPFVKQNYSQIALLGQNGVLIKPKSSLGTYGDVTLPA
jgi:hypothetical protein